MFENLSSKPPEDIFSDTDVAPVAVPSAPAAPAPIGGQTHVSAPTAVPANPFIPSAPPAPEMHPEALALKRIETRQRKAKGVVLIILAVIIFVFAAGVVYAFLAKPSGELPRITGGNTSAPLTRPSSPTIDGQTRGSAPTTDGLAPMPAAPVAPAAVESDADKDGLSDERERKLGTSPRNADSDDDGLYDREEVEVYQTDPLDVDTDDDSYLDGEEIEHGYNPKGPGKLFELPTE